MEIINEYTKHIRAFESLLHNKGYVADCQLISTERNLPLLQGPLKKCLHQYLTHLQKAGRNREHFTLQTHAEYLSADNYKRCDFFVCFDLTEGLTISRLTIGSKHPDETQHLSIRNQQDIPAKHAIIGRFRKPKSWDRMIRGESRWKRKW